MQSTILEADASVAQDVLMTVPEFAEKVLRCSESMGWRLVREHAFPVIRHGRLVRIEPKKALANYIAKFGQIPSKSKRGRKPKGPTI